MEFTYELIIILFVVGFVAGTIDTIAGGGGLLTIPALLWAGLSPASALATNKLQSVFGTFTASIYFLKHKLINIEEIKLMILMAFLGSIVGGFVLIQIDPTILEKLIPILLILIGIYFLVSKNIDSIDRHKLMSANSFAVSFVFVIGFYDGFFGPGTGTFFTIAFLYFLAYNISKATAHTKVLNFITNFASLLFFLIFGEICFLIGLVMGVGQVLGALLGAKLVMLKGVKIIKPLIVIVSFAMSIKLLIG
jgi:uncharacterized membrane protein YfcA